MSKVILHVPVLPVSSESGRAISRCLAKDVIQRCQSAVELLADLRLSNLSGRACCCSVRV
jgi:hypothetical protein